MPDSPHKIFIGGLPNYLNEDQVNLRYENRSLSIAIGILHFAKKSKHCRSASKAFIRKLNTKVIVLIQYFKSYSLDLSGAFIFTTILTRLLVAVCDL